MRRRGLVVNMDKTKNMVTGIKNEVNLEVRRHPCGVCGQGVGANSILCTTCRKWCHKRCAGVRTINRVNNFCHPACIRRRGEVEVPEDDLLEIDGEVIQEVKEFCYLGDVILDSDGGVERSVSARIATTWKKWREISSMLRNKVFH